MLGRGGFSVIHQTKRQICLIYCVLYYEISTSSFLTTLFDTLLSWYWRIRHKMLMIIFDFISSDSLHDWKHDSIRHIRFIISISHPFLGLIFQKFASNRFAFTSKSENENVVLVVSLESTSNDASAVDEAVQHATSAVSSIYQFILFFVDVLFVFDSCIKSNYRNN